MDTATGTYPVSSDLPLTCDPFAVISMKMNCFGLFVAVLYAITGGGHGALGEDSSHETHDHDENPLFEQAAVYVLESGTNNIMILPAVGESDFAEESLLAFMVLPAVNADQNGLEEAEQAAETCEQHFLLLLQALYDSLDATWSSCTTETASCTAALTSTYSA